MKDFYQKKEKTISQHIPEVYYAATQSNLEKQKTRFFKNEITNPKIFYK